jgi:hypothetical protein
MAPVQRCCSFLNFTKFFLVQLVGVEASSPAPAFRTDTPDLLASCCFSIFSRRYPIYLNASLIKLLVHNGFLVRALVNRDWSGNKTLSASGCRGFCKE